jgi:hypothetical protein
MEPDYDGKLAGEVAMHVTGPNPREMSSVLAQLRHLYMLMGREDIVTPNMVGILSRQIKRLESLQRVLFEQSPSASELGGLNDAPTSSEGKPED